MIYQTEAAHCTHVYIDGQRWEVIDRPASIHWFWVGSVQGLSTHVVLIHQHTQADPKIEVYIQRRMGLDAHRLLCDATLGCSSDGISGGDVCVCVALTLSSVWMANNDR